MHAVCPECGALWKEGVSCQEAFHQMLFWENDERAFGVVHHLMVVCYNLQHPSLLSPDGLNYSKKLLADFVELGLSPAEARRRSRDQVDSGKRTWKVTARPGQTGQHAPSIQWMITAIDVIAGGRDHYCDNVRLWASQTNEAINNG